MLDNHSVKLEIRLEIFPSCFAALQKSNIALEATSSHAFLDERNNDAVGQSHPFISRNISLNPAESMPDG